jgi:hypothetical protein
MTLFDVIYCQRCAICFSDNGNKMGNLSRVRAKVKVNVKVKVKVKHRQRNRLEMRVVLFLLLFVAAGSSLFCLSVTMPTVFIVHYMLPCENRPCGRSFRALSGGAALLRFRTPLSHELLSI